MTAYPSSFRLGLFVLTIILAGCGDVGDAPEAELGEAVDVEAGEGQALAIDTTRSSVNWKAAKVTRAHDGGFRSFEGTVTVADENVTAIDLQIDATSIWSDTDRLTNHLKSDDFFDVETYPTATFSANQIVPADSAGATHLITGNLTMHGVTHSLTFPATIMASDESVHAEADFIIDRRDWGITYAGQADDLIENDVRLMFDIYAERQESLATGGDGTR